MKKFLGITSAVTSGVAAVLIAAPAMALSPLINGSFESGMNPGSYTTVSSGDNTTIQGWTVSSGTVDYIGTYWQAADGNRSLDLSGNGAGAVQQTLTTVAGHTYTVSFDLAGNPDGGPTVKNLQVSGGGTPAAYTFDTTGKTTAAMGWTPETYTFTASSSNTTLTFASEDNTAYGPALDNVSVALNPPTKVSQCNNGGWQEYTNPSYASAAQCRSAVRAEAEGNLQLANPHQQIRFEASNRQNGNVTYTNFDYPGGLYYKAKVTCASVDPSAKDARFVFQIPAGHPGLSGLYIVAYAKSVKNAPDQFGFEATSDQTTANQWCQTGTGFSPTMYTVTKGRVMIES